MPGGRLPKKRRMALPEKKGVKRQYLEDNFASLPDDHEVLKNGHVYFLFITNSNSQVKTIRAIMERYSCQTVRIRLQSLLNAMKKFSSSTSESVMTRFKALCCEPFVLHLSEAQLLPEHSSTSDQALDASSSEPSIAERPQTSGMMQSPETAEATRLPQTSPASVLAPGTPSSQTQPVPDAPSSQAQPSEVPQASAKTLTPKTAEATQSPNPDLPGPSSANRDYQASESPWSPDMGGVTLLPETPASTLQPSEKSSKIRSSKRKTPLTPREKQLKSRLDFVTESKVEMKGKYERKIAKLKELVNYQKVHKIKYLNQELNRKKLQLAKKKAELADLRSQLCSSFVGERLNEMKKKSKNEKKKHKRDTKRLTNQLSEYSHEVQKLENELKMKKETIVELENENLMLKETVEQLQTETGDNFQKGGKTYSVGTRLFVYDCIVNNVPTKNVPILLQKFAKRSGMPLEQVPHRSTVEFMARELGVVSDLMAAEILFDQQDLTLGFDATTQEGLHINSIHVTTSDKCYVLAVDQLAGGTAEDYELHINSTLDGLTDIYCKYYTTDFNETRPRIIKNISNTMTDRATVNHATIQRLELNWGKNLNELNCHLHPLDTIASSVWTALKTSEPNNLSKKLFGTDSMSHLVILAFNKFRFKDGKGDPKGFLSALESASLPKGLLPRYRGNRLHVMFHIGGKLHQHEDFFTKLLQETRVTCGDLQSALLHDYNSDVTKVELHVLGLLGKLLTGPWMAKFYQSSRSDVSHVDGIGIVRDVVDILKKFSGDSAATLSTTTDFFGNDLPSDDATLTALRSQPVDAALFKQMMEASLLKVIEVLERQYARYFSIDVTETLRKETASSHCHNIDAETVMGMFSAAKEHAPNATMCFLSSRIKACKNDVINQFLDNMPTEKRNKVINMAVSQGRKQRTTKRKKAVEIKAEIARRMGEKLQKKKTSHCKKVEEKKIKESSLVNIPEVFSDLDDSTIEAMTDVLTGKVVGRQICHVWYDADSQHQTMYNGKIEKLLKKGGGTYRVGYWLEGEDYEQDAEDFEVSKYALAADLACGDLSLS